MNTIQIFFRTHIIIKTGYRNRRTQIVLKRNGIRKSWITKDFFKLIEKNSRIDENKRRKYVSIPEMGNN